MGILEGKGYMKGVSEYDETRFMAAMNYTYAIISEAFTPPSKILDRVERFEGAVFWSEQDMKITIENYRNAIAARAFSEKENLLADSNNGYDMGTKTACAKIIRLRKEYVIDERSIREMGNLNQTMDLLKMIKWADKLSRKTARKALHVNVSKTLGPER